MDTVETDAAQMMMGAPYNSIGTKEYGAIAPMFLGDPERPLSGYLAGKERGGVYVQALEEAWQGTFGVKHAIACNSNTSGMLAAAFAARLKHGDMFACPAMTMTATAAAPMFTGARPVFCDIEDESFGLDELVMGDMVKATLVTNLFGHPAKLLQHLRRQCDQLGRIMIEDNAQAPFAMENGKYCGTIGHIGVFSLNVHKHFHCGEGGVVVTDNDELAERMRAFINHGEHMSFNIGLNLRMPEICAAIALTQLSRAPGLIQGRVEQAEEILDAIGDVPGIRMPIVRQGCTHVWYIIPFLIEHYRPELCYALRHLGVPVTEGYVPPLYRMPAFQRMARKDGCPIAEDLEDRRLFHIENCAHSFSMDEINRIGDAFKRAAETIDAKAPRRL